VSLEYKKLVIQINNIKRNEVVAVFDWELDINSLVLV
jgi:hypothetical protein